jgi:hypothetical protein
MERWKKELLKLLISIMKMILKDRIKDFNIRDKLFKIKKFIGDYLKYRFYLIVSLE